MKKQREPSADEGEAKFEHFRRNMNGIKLFLKYEYF